MPEGCVYLVGAGPGDPELLTVKALRLIRSADVVVLDRLVGKAIEDLVPVGTTRIFAGKETGRHTIDQDGINALLVRLARSGRQVVRLKGGDPFIFGRGGEEAAHLARHGVTFVIVPGITAAAGCSAYAGIPLTHRDWTHGVHFITGHAKAGGVPDYDWTALANDKATLVIYMGLANIARLASALIAAGLSAETPAAAVEHGTTVGQRRVVGTVAELAAIAHAAGLRPPTLIIIGRVVALAGSIDWFQPDAAAGDAAVPVEARRIAV